MTEIAYIQPNVQNCPVVNNGIICMLPISQYFHSFLAEELGTLASHTFLYHPPIASLAEFQLCDHN